MFSEAPRIIFLCHPHGTSSETLDRLQVSFEFSLSKNSSFPFLLLKLGHTNFFRGGECLSVNNFTIKMEFSHISRLDLSVESDAIHEDLMQQRESQTGVHCIPAEIKD